MKKDCLTKQELYEYFRARVATYPTQKAAAEAAGVSDAYLGDVMKNRRAIGPTLCHWLGVEPQAVYRRIEEG